MVSKFVPVYDDRSDHSGTLMLDFCTNIGRSFDGVLTSHGLGDAKDLDYGDRLTGFDLAKAMFWGLNPPSTNPDLKRIVRIKNLLSKVQSEYLALSEGGRINLTIWATGTPERISDNRIVIVGNDAPDRTSHAVKALPTIYDDLRQPIDELLRHEDEVRDPNKRLGATNWRAAFAMRGCIGFWGSIHGSYPSRFWGDATDFADFVEDVWALVEFNQSPRNAFEAYFAQVNDLDDLGDTE